MVGMKEGLLKSLRISKGLTMQEVGDACGVSRMTVSYLERGMHAHASRAAVRILEFYEVSTPKALLEAGVCPCCSGTGRPRKCIKEALSEGPGARRRGPN